MRLLALIPLILVQPAPSSDLETIGERATAFFEAARAHDSEAFDAGRCKDSRRSDRVLLETFYEVLGSGPFEVSYPEPPLVNGQRALAAFQVSSSLDTGAAAPESWLWLEQQATSGWTILRLDSDQRYSREWLFETHKPGLASDPAAAGLALFDAMHTGNPTAAERACSDLAWAGTDGGLQTLYEATQDMGLRFGVHAPEVQGTRALVPFGLDYGSSDGVDFKADSLLLLELRGSGWIATGFNRDTDRAQLFLRGEVAAIEDPASPFLCAERLMDAINRDQPMRIRHLSGGDFRHSAQGLLRYERLAESGGSVELPRTGMELSGERCSVRVQLRAAGNAKAENRLWLLERTHAGWRLVGETERPDRANAFLSSPAEPR